MEWKQRYGRFKQQTVKIAHERIICPKVNTVAQLKFELVYNNIAVEQVTTAQRGQTFLI